MQNELDLGERERASDGEIEQREEKEMRGKGWGGKMNGRGRGGREESDRESAGEMGEERSEEHTSELQSQT